MALKLHESLDTNIILRLALRDVPGQCAKIVDLFMRQSVVYEVADLAITEAVYVMQKQGNTREQIVETLRVILDNFGLCYNRELFERVFPMYLDHLELSFNDCCLAGYAALNRSEPLWTFDKNLAEISGTAKLLK